MHTQNISQSSNTLIKMNPRHAWCHLVLDLKSTGENPRNHKTLAEEDTLGKITKLANAVHGATVIQRFFDRFRLFLAIHWEHINNLTQEEVEEIS